MIQINFSFQILFNFIILNNLFSAAGHASACPIVWTVARTRITTARTAKHSSAATLHKLLAKINKRS